MSTGTLSALTQHILLCSPRPELNFCAILPRSNGLKTLTQKERKRIDMETAVWGLIGTIIGAFVSIGTNYMTARNAAALQVLNAERTREDQKRAFQKETLLKLQDEVSNALRFVARAHLADRGAFRAGTAWGRNMLGDDIAEGMRSAFGQVSLLTARVVDDQLRHDVKEALALASSVAHARDEDSAIHAFSKAMDAANHLMERIGECLRRQY
jgi:hypothetical protein